MEPGFDGVYLFIITVLLECFSFFFFFWCVLLPEILASKQVVLF